MSLPKAVKLGWSGFQELGKGALFLENDQEGEKAKEGEDSSFYIKQKYAPKVETLSEKQKTLMIKFLEEYNPETQIVVFYLNEVFVLDMFKETGKTCEEFVSTLKRSKPQLSGKPIKKAK